MRCAAARAAVAAYIVLCACRQPPAASDGTVVGHFNGGDVSSGELQHAVDKLPPVLRQQFQTATGERELVQSLIDRKLLILEARKRGLAADPDIKRQVTELEERLLLQVLVEKEESASPAVDEHRAREWYDAHKAELTEPERVHLGRVLVKGGKADAKKRANAIQKRLQAGEPLARLAALGSGPEKAQGGELGWVAKGEAKLVSLQPVAFDLPKAGASVVIEDPEGAAVLVLLEKRAARVPPFEEARAGIFGKLEPARRRKVFDDLVARVRQGAEVHLPAVANR
jgi:parvulin-like peptidyl-prolyl isomerase